MAPDAILLTHCGAERVTRADLARIAAPTRTATWVPIQHSDLLDALHAALAQRGLEVRREQYAVQHQGTRLFGTLDLDWYNTGESAAAVGLRTANDKSMALQLAIGLKVFVCDNLCFAGDLIALKRKYTARLDLPREFAHALDRYQAGLLTLRAGIRQLQATPLTAHDAKAWFYDIFAQRLLPLRYFPQVVQTYHTMTVPRYGATLWALHNAVTTHLQTLPPGPAFRATVRLGQLCGLQ